MDNTSKMITLLGKMRKQMNGAVADAMFYYGTRYGLNYGVSLPTVREIAEETGKDHELALYLFKQQVRELKLAALHIADAEQITATTSSTWADGITTSELAEEAAFAMLSHCPSLNEIYDKWVKSENEFATYAALMALSRSGEISLGQLEPMPNITCRYSTSRPIAQGVVALLAAAYLNPALQEAVKATLERLPDTPASKYVRDEMSWRMEF